MPKLPLFVDSNNRRHPSALFQSDPVSDIEKILISRESALVPPGFTRLHNFFFW
jgi:hypothetical protein